MNTERFDWYQATVPGVDEEEILGSYLADEPMSSFFPVGGETHGYARAGVIRVGDADVLRLLWGGNNDAAPNIRFSGEQAAQGASWLRSRFPNHAVTRADACVDFEDENAWTILLDRCMEVKRECKVASGVAGDWLDDGSPKGRTLYLGASSSVVRTRLYEKGKQQKQGLDWVRAEVQVRPKKPLERYACSCATPAQIWGLSRWTMQLRERFDLSEVPKMCREVTNRTAFDARKDWLLRQGGNTLKEWAEMLGGFPALAEELERLLNK
jgi:DNA relaxase NicK